MKTRLLPILLLILSGPACFAASPWDGTWKLNQAKSKLTGDEFTLTALPNGGFHLSTPSHSLDIDYPCNGSDYAVLGDRTGTCKKIDDRHYEMAGKLKGQLIWHGTSIVSDDGKHLTNTAIERRPDGVDVTQSNVYERIGTGIGRAGTWRNIKSSQSVADVMIIKVTGDTMRTEEPAFKSVITARLDGSNAKMEGPETLANFVLRCKTESPLRIRYTTMLNGKPSLEGTQTLSSDGKTIVQEEWEVGSPGEKQRYVFEKQ